ncbi:pyridoxal 5'-phosphate synthase [Microbacterium sp.]|uniref:pyridoxine/pyridoxamine 5'-phosphate oxidase n=1 Tax=Microbacterium sp. TaxID=51671 RepID=UPI0039E3C3C7
MSELIAQSPADPLALAREWIPASVHPGPLMTLATIDEDGLPDARSVLLTELDADGFHFHTDLASRKVAQLRAHPEVALCIPLVAEARQLTVQGRAREADAAELARAYAARPPYLQQLAWLNSHEFAELPQPERVSRWQAFAAAHPDGFAQAPGWTGFVVEPVRMTFWFGSTETASRRLEYRRGDDGWRAHVRAG